MPSRVQTYHDISRLHEKIMLMKPPPDPVELFIGEYDFSNREDTLRYFTGLRGEAMASRTEFAVMGPDDVAMVDGRVMSISRMTQEDLDKAITEGREFLNQADLKIKAAAQEIVNHPELATERQTELNKAIKHQGEAEEKIAKLMSEMDRRSEKANFKQRVRGVSNVLTEKTS